MFKSKNPQSGCFHDTNDRGLGFKTEKIRTRYHLFGWNRQYLKPPSKSSLLNIPILVLAIDIIYIYIICVQCSLPYGHHIHMCVALISSTCMKPCLPKTFVYHGISHKPKLHFHLGSW